MKQAKQSRVNPVGIENSKGKIKGSFNVIELHINSTGEMMLKFKRINIETGAEYIGEFNASHHWCFADPEIEPTKLLNRIADDLIVKWNRQQPKNWQYSRINK